MAVSTSQFYGFFLAFLALCPSLSLSSPLSPFSPDTPLPAFPQDPPLPKITTTLSARNSECFSTHSFLPDPHPTYVNPRSCGALLSRLSNSRTYHTFGSETDFDDDGPWVWPGKRPGYSCYISLHSAELGNTIRLRLSDIWWAAILILRDCERGLYGGRHWIKPLPGEFYVRVAGTMPVDEPG